MGKTTGFLIIMFVSVFLYSCSSKNVDRADNKTENKNEPEMVKGDDLNESNEDLFKTDYKEIYDELSGKGEWVEVSAEDIGIDPKNISAGESELQKFLSENILGVKSAYADEANPAMLFVWKPAPELAVTLGSGANTETSMSVTGGYVPYANGQWVNTNNGWYFAAPTPEEEIVHHYGRWAFKPEIGGWVWVPGRTWSPAWVEWKQNDSYVSWAPLSPGVYIEDNTVSFTPAPPEQYIVVEKKYFVEPQVYKYYYPENKVVIVNEMEPIKGITVVDRRVINTGPDVIVISNATGVTIPTANVNQVHVLSGVHFDDQQVNTYVPVFRVHKGKKDRKVVTIPTKFRIVSAGNDNSHLDLRTPQQKNGNDNSHLDLRTPEQRKGNDNSHLDLRTPQQKKGNDNSHLDLRTKEQKANDEMKVRGNQNNKKNNNDTKIFKEKSKKKEKNYKRNDEQKVKGNKDNSKKEGNNENRKGGDNDHGKNNKGKNKK